MNSYFVSTKHKQTGLRVARLALASLTALVAAKDLTCAANLRNEQSVESRPAGEPMMAIIALRDQQITIYDAKGWIMRAPVSSGQTGRETPAGIFTVLQKEAEHYSNMYDDAYMPHMQRPLGRASRSTVALCRDILHRMAASGCRTTLPNGCSMRRNSACA